MSNKNNVKKNKTTGQKKGVRLVCLFLAALTILAGASTLLYFIFS